MLIVGCQKCGEMKVIAGDPDLSGTTRIMWTCSHCGAGQLLELALARDAKRGDLRSVIRGFALSDSTSKFGDSAIYSNDKKSGTAQSDD